MSTQTSQNLKELSIKLDDQRYIIGIEYTGNKIPLYVARFCNSYISSHNEHRDAINACLKHKIKRYK